MKFKIKLVFAIVSLLSGAVSQAQNCPIGSGVVYGFQNPQDYSYGLQNVSYGPTYFSDISLAAGWVTIETKTGVCDPDFDPIIYLYREVNGKVYQDSGGTVYSWAADDNPNAAFPRDARLRTYIPQAGTYKLLVVARQGSSRGNIKLYVNGAQRGPNAISIGGTFVPHYRAAGTSYHLNFFTLGSGNSQIWVIEDPSSSSGASRYPGRVAAYNNDYNADDPVWGHNARARAEFSHPVVAVIVAAVNALSAGSGALYMGLEEYNGNPNHLISDYSEDGGNNCHAHTVNVSAINDQYPDDFFYNGFEESCFYSASDSGSVFAKSKNAYKRFFSAHMGGYLTEVSGPQQAHVILYGNNLTVTHSAVRPSLHGRPSGPWGWESTVCIDCPRVFHPYGDIGYGPPKVFYKFTQ